MGLPDVVGALGHRRKGFIGVAYVLGMCAFVCGLWPLTDPKWHPSSGWDDLVKVGRSLR